MDLKYKKAHHTEAETPYQHLAQRKNKMLTFNLAESST